MTAKTSSPATPQLAVTLISFGFKYGEPLDAEMILDVRFLPNPYWEEAMRDRTGQDDEVAAYVLESDSGREFLDRLTPLLQFVLNRYEQTGRGELRIGIGCTGGQHRSVAVAERLADVLAAESVMLRVVHRDIHRT